MLEKNVNISVLLQADVPSVFTMKLRKHLRAKRLEGATQLGTDRVVDFRRAKS